LLKPEIGTTVLVDESEISIYGEIGADQAKTHKMLSIRLRDGSTREITELSPLIRTLGRSVRLCGSILQTNQRARGRALGGQNDKT
jgi:hypothetical protein